MYPDFKILKYHHPVFSPMIDIIHPLCCQLCMSLIDKSGISSTSLYKESILNHKYFDSVYNYLTNRVYCLSCIQDLEFLKINYERFNHCASCGRECISSFENRYCIRCINKRPFKNLRVRSFFYYSGAVRNIIHLMKYKQNQIISNWFALFFLKNISKLFQTGTTCENLCSNHNWDEIIFIPSNINNIKTRKFYSTWYLSSVISSLLNTDYKNSKLLISSSSKITPRSWIPSSRRKKLNSPKFRLAKVDKKNSLKNKKILIIDDVITTGSSIVSAVELISKEDPLQIDVISLAQSKRLHRYLML